MTERAQLNVQGIGQLPKNSGDKLFSAEEVEKILSYRLPPSTKQLQKIAAFEAGTDGKLASLVSLVTCDPLISARLIATMNSAGSSRIKTVLTSEEAIKLLGVNKFRTFLQDAKAPKGMEGLLAGRATACIAVQDLLFSASLARVLHAKVFPSQFRPEFLELITFLLGYPVCALSFFRPELYAALSLEALEKKDLGFDRALREIMGLPRHQAAAMVARSLGLPEDFSVVLSFSQLDNVKSASAAQGKTLEVKNAATIAVVAQALTRAYLDGRDLQAIESCLKDVGQKNAQLSKILPGIFRDAYTHFAQNLEILGLNPNLIHSPERYLSPDDSSHESTSQTPPIAGNEKLNLFLSELRASLRSVEGEQKSIRLTHAAYLTLLALTRAFDFERAMLFLSDTQQRVLFPSFLLGVPLEKFNAELFFLEQEKYWDSSLVIAAKKKRAVFQGEPAFGGNKIFVAFPLMCGEEVLGVFYAEREEAQGPRTTPEEMRCMALSELWQASQT